MVGVMIPVHCTIVPISSIASSLGAKVSYWFLVLVYTAFNLAQAVYLYIGFILWLWRADFLSDSAVKAGKVYSIQGNAEFHRGTFHRYGNAVCFHWECLKL